MREIKVRFWDGVNKKFWYGGQEGESIGDECFQTFFLDGLLVGSLGESIDVGMGNFDFRSRDLPSSQYTGLKDVNDVEIFEGDIVRFINFDTTGGHLDDTEHTGLVKFQSGIYEIWKNVDSEYYGSDGAFILNHAWLQDDEFEIIGNIYEHPHLLEATL